MLSKSLGQSAITGSVYRRYRAAFGYRSGRCAYVYVYVYACNYTHHHTHTNWCCRNVQHIRQWKRENILCCWFDACDAHMYLCFVDSLNLRRIFHRAKHTHTHTYRSLSVQSSGARTIFSIMHKRFRCGFRYVTLRSLWFFEGEVCDFACACFMLFRFVQCYVQCLLRQYIIPFYRSLLLPPPSSQLPSLLLAAAAAVIADKVTVVIVIVCCLFWLLFSLSARDSCSAGKIKRARRWWCASHNNECFRHALIWFSSRIHMQKRSVFFLFCFDDCDRITRTTFGLPEYRRTDERFSALPKIACILPQNFKRAHSSKIPFHFSVGVCVDFRRFLFCCRLNFAMRCIYFPFFILSM